MSRILRSRLKASGVEQDGRRLNLQEAFSKGRCSIQSFFEISGALATPGAMASRWHQTWLLLIGLGLK